MDILGTRATKEQYKAVKALIGEAQYDEVSRIIKIVRSDIKRTGNIVVCTGGTSIYQWQKRLPKQQSLEAMLPASMMWGGRYS